MIRHRLWALLLVVLPWAAAGVYVAPPWACSPAPEAANPLCPPPARGDSRCTKHGCDADAGCAREHCNAVQGQISGTMVVMDAWLSIRGSFCRKTQWTLSECCALCQESPACNAWSYCNDPNGCGTGCVTSLHEYKASETPVYSVSPVTYTRRLNPDHHCTKAGAWPYQTCTLRRVGGPAKPEAPPLVADAKASAGWVSGIVSKVVGAEVSIAAIPSGPATATPPAAAPAAGNDTGLREVPTAPHTQLHVEQLRADEPEEDAETEDTDAEQQHQHEQEQRARAHAWQAEREREENHRERRRWAPRHLEGEPAAMRSQQYSDPRYNHPRGDPSRMQAQYAHEEHERWARFLEQQRQAYNEMHPQRAEQHQQQAQKPQQPQQPQQPKEQRQQQAQQPQPHEQQPQQHTTQQNQQHAETQHPVQLPGRNTTASHEELRPEQPAAKMAPQRPQDPHSQRSGPAPPPTTPKPAGAAPTPDLHLKQPAAAAKPAYEMQPVPDEDADVPKVNPPQAPKAAAAAASKNAQQQHQQQQLGVKPKYEMQPVPDNDADAPKTNPPQAPKATAAGAVAGHDAAHQQQQQQQRQEVNVQSIRPKFEMQPVPDDADAPKTNPPQAPKTAAAAAAAAANSEVTTGGQQQQQQQQLAVKRKAEIKPTPGSADMQNTDMQKAGQTPKPPAAAAAAGTTAPKSQPSGAAAQTDTTAAALKPDTDGKTTRVPFKPEPQPELPSKVSAHAEQQKQPLEPAAAHSKDPASAAKKPLHAAEPADKPQPQPQQAVKPVLQQQSIWQELKASEKPAAKEQPHAEPEAKATKQQQQQQQQTAKAESAASAATAVVPVSGAKPATPDAPKPSASVHVQAKPSQAPEADRAQTAKAAQAPEVLVPEIAAMPLADPEQFEQMEQMRRAEVPRGAQHAHQQHNALDVVDATTFEADSPKAQANNLTKGTAPQKADTPLAAQPAPAQQAAVAAQQQGAAAAAEPPVQAHLFTTTEFATGDSESTSAREVKEAPVAAAHLEIAPSDPSQGQTIRQPAAASSTGAVEELPGVQDAQKANSTATAGSLNAANNAVVDVNSSASSAQAPEPVDKAATKLPAARPIAVEQDQHRTLPPKKATSKKNAASSLQGVSRLAAAAVCVAMLQLVL